MPRRKRNSPGPRSSPAPAAPRESLRSSSDDDAIARFAAALRDADERERIEHERRRAERAEADRLAEARTELDQAIERVRAARRSGSGTAEADAAWRAAKARVIELETGAPPDWADGRGAGPDTVADDDAPHDDDPPDDATPDDG